MQDGEQGGERGADQSSGPRSWAPTSAVPLDQALAALRSLHRVTKQVHASLDLTETLNAVAEGVVAVAGFGLAVVNLLDAEGRDLEVVTVAGEDDARRTLLGTRDSVAVWQEFLAASERHGNLHFLSHTRSGHLVDELSWVPPIEASDDPDAWHPLDALFASLLGSDGALLGVLSVDLPVGQRQPGPLQLELLELFADQAAIALQHARTFASLRASESRAQHAAAHDELTGLANRSLLARAADDLAGEPGTDIAVLLIDLDAFKDVNDSVGHGGGDQVLKVVARRLQRAVRADDLVARTGGDEFVVLMHGPGAQTLAGAMAQRIEALLAEPVDSDQGMHRVGASIGVGLGHAPVDLTAMLDDADRAMYQEKRRRAARRPEQTG